MARITKTKAFYYLATSKGPAFNKTSLGLFFSLSYLICFFLCSFVHCYCLLCVCVHCCCCRPLGFVSLQKKPWCVSALLDYNKVVPFHSIFTSYEQDFRSFKHHMILSVSNRTNQSWNQIFHMFHQSILLMNNRGIREK